MKLKAINLIIISSNKGDAKFGSEGEGIFASVSRKKSYRSPPIFDIIFPPFPIIHLAVYVGGSLEAEVKVNFGQKNLKLSLTGTLTASAEIKAGRDEFLSFSAGAEGTAVSASGFVTISKDGIKPGYKFGSGQVDVYVVARALDKEIWKKSYTVFKGWSKSSEDK